MFLGFSLDEDKLVRRVYKEGVDKRGCIEIYTKAYN
jgi:hypothetical protein